MIPERPSLQPRAGSGDRIECLVELIDALVNVVVEENISLAMGLPASQLHTQRKVALADEFEQWVADVSMRRLLLFTSDRALQENVVRRIECLHTSMAENMIRLRAAIEASQRRIDAVMAAIREQISDSSPYNSNGRVHGQSVSCGRSIRA